MAVSTRYQLLLLVAACLIFAPATALVSAPFPIPSPSPSPSPTGPASSHSPISAEEYQREQQALVALYHQTGGDTSWLHTRGWLNSSATGHCNWQHNCSRIGHCNWHGVWCNQQGAVATVWLQYNGLTGTVPVQQILALNQLTVLGLGVNQLSGTITEQVGQLRQLTVLALETNKLSGTITERVGQLSLLTELGLGLNQLSGTIVEHLGQLRLLTVLGNQNNRISGTVPLLPTDLQQALLSNNEVPFILHCNLLCPSTMLHQ